MRKLSADYIFPVNKEPVKKGILIIEDNGKIINLINPATLDYGISEIEHFKGLIFPGFVNAHCHLEFSHLKGKIKQHTGLNEFILNLEKLKSSVRNQSDIIESIESAENEMLSNGVVAVGDILNTSITFETRKRSKLVYHNFIEVYGSNPAIASQVFNDAMMLYRKFIELSGCSVVPHSAYSVSEKLFKCLKQFAYDNGNIISMHHQESEDENLYFRDKSGNIPKRDELMGIDISSFKPIGLRPLETVSDHLPSKNYIQLVHNTFSDKEDILFALKKFSNIWFCLCPNANLYIENKLPDIGLFIENNCAITIGTDSYASNTGLSVLEELKTISKIYPDIELQDLLKWATINGAEYLRLNDKFGSFERGKHPGINLIEDVDVAKPALLSNSKVKVLL